MFVCLIKCKKQLIASNYTLFFISILPSQNLFHQFYQNLMQNNFASSSPSGGHQNDASINQMIAPPSRGARPSANRYNHPLTPAATGGMMGATMTQNTLIKNIQQSIPKINDSDRQNCREQIVDSLIREPSMTKTRIQDLAKTVAALQQQQSSSRMTKDECSSGGTNPTPVTNLDNEVNTMIQVGIWLEESVCTQIGDSKSANYKTLVRRVSQNLRSKEDFRQNALQARSQDDANNLIQNFAAGRGPATRQNQGSETKEGQEQSNQNPFAAATTVGAANPFGGAARGGMPSRGGRGRGGMGRGATSRFAAPMVFPTPSSSGENPMGKATSLPTPPVDALPQQEEMKQSSDMQSHEQTVDSGAADNMIPSGSLQPSSLVTEEIQQDTQLGLVRFESTKVLKEEINNQTQNPLDFLDNLAVQQLPDGGAPVEEQKVQQESNIDFLNEYITMTDNDTTQQNAAEAQVIDTFAPQTEADGVKDQIPPLSSNQVSTKEVLTFPEQEQTIESLDPLPQQLTLAPSQDDIVEPPAQTADQICNSPNVEQQSSSQHPDDQLVSQNATTPPISQRQQEEISTENKTDNQIEQRPDIDISQPFSSQQYQIEEKKELADITKVLDQVVKEEEKAESKPSLVPVLNLQPNNQIESGSQQRITENENDYFAPQKKVDVSKNSSKPSINGGRMTPSNMSSRQSVGIVEGKMDFNETGSMHMSNEFSNNERFIPMIDNQQRKMNTALAEHKEIQLRTQKKSRQPKMMVNNDSKFTATQESLPSSYQASDHHNRGTFVSNNEINEGQSHKQVEGFMKNNNIFPPPESCAISSMSLPITTFEDTQQMMKAYKRKKRELQKLKDQFFKMDTEFMTIKQKSSIYEEELAHSQRRCHKVEKQLKQLQMKEQQKDNSLTEKNLMLKTKEAEVFQKELSNQKLENQKLREKVRDLLKKQGSSGTSATMPAGHALTQEDIQTQLVSQQQKHMQEMQRQRLLHDKQLESNQEELNYYKKKCERVEQELNETRQSMQQLKENELQMRRDIDLNYQEIQSQRQKQFQESEHFKQVQTSLQKQLEDTTNEKHRLIQSSNSQNSSQNSLNSELSRQQQVINQLMNEKTQLESQLSASRNETQMVRQTLNQNEHQLRQINQQNNHFQSQIKDQLSQTEMQKTQISQLEQDKQHLIQQVQQLNSIQGHTNTEGGQSQISSLRSQPDHNSNSWEVLESDQSKEQKHNQSARDRSDQQKDNLLLQSQYFAMQTKEREIQQHPSPKMVEKKQPEQPLSVQNAYDYTEKDNSQVQTQQFEQIAPMQIASALFNDSEPVQESQNRPQVASNLFQNEETPSSFNTQHQNQFSVPEQKTMVDLSSFEQYKTDADPMNYFNNLPQQHQEQPKPVQHKPPTSQQVVSPQIQAPAPVVLAQKVAPPKKQQQPVMLNSNPYDFFDNEEEEDSQQVSGGVIPTSMFD